MLYTLSATARLLNATHNTIQRIEPFVYVVWVWVRGQRPTFVSKRAFQQDFVNFRRASVQFVKVRRLNDRCFQAQGKDEIYDLTLQQTTIVCSCKDYEKQIETFGKGCCKHGYAVLGQLGFTSLLDYIDARFTG